MSRDLVFGFCDPRFKKVRDLFARSVESGYEVGATLAVEYRGEMVINLWGGYQDAAKTRLWQEDTLVNVFSVTKGIVATCIARLVEEKRLDIYQPVS
ncbi:MAG: CubicO group peptidase (beta-lactamase class C family), partial [Oceanospirillaceae bacterium]